MKPIVVKQEPFPCFYPLCVRYWVLPGRFMAGEYPGSPNPAAARKKLAALAEAGIDTFVDLTEPGEITHPYRRSLGLPPFGAVRYHNFPLRDGSVPSSRLQLSRILDAVDSSLKEGGRVYLHCRGGAGRTGTVVGAWLVRRGWSGPEALDCLRGLWNQCESIQWHMIFPMNIVQQIYVLCGAVPRAAAPGHLHVPANGEEGTPRPFPGRRAAVPWERW